jgi:hypothetical protein
VIGAALRAATLSLIATAHHSIFLLVIAGAFHAPPQDRQSSLRVLDLLAHFVMTVEITLAGDEFYKQWCLCDQNC